MPTWLRSIFLAIFRDYREYHTDTTVRFVVKMDGTRFKEMEREGFHKAFKLQATLSMTQMVLFDVNGVIRRYDGPLSILEDFYTLRLKYYTKRKAYWLEALSAEAKRLQNQARFIEEKIKGLIKVEDVKRGAIIKMLQERKYDSDPVKAWKKKQGVAAMDEEPVTNEEDPEAAVEKVLETGPDYDYLMGMSFWKLSNEQKLKLLEERDKKVRAMGKFLFFLCPGMFGWILGWLIDFWKWSGDESVQKWKKCFLDNFSFHF